MQNWLLSDCIQVLKKGVARRMDWARLSGMWRFGVNRAEKVGCVSRAVVQSLFVCVLWSVAQLSWAVPPLATAPELASLSQVGSHASVDARLHWQSAIVGTNSLKSSQAGDPEVYWMSPNAEFKTGSVTERMRLAQGQRYVARLNMLSTGFGANIHLVFKMPRLDAVHVAYRYDNEPWVKASAGDTLAMNTWASSDRQPSFDIPLRPGNLNLVAEVAHLGVVDSPMQLQSTNTFRDQQLLYALRTGGLLGVNLILAVLGLAFAMGYGRPNFLAISVMAIVIVMVTGSVSGMAGIYLLNDSATFNDESKFWAQTVWCCVFPWVTSIALVQRPTFTWSGRAASAYALLGLAAATVFMGYKFRNAALAWIPVMALFSIFFALCLLAKAFLRKQTNAWAVAPAVVLYGAALLAPLAAFLGYILDEKATLWAALVMMLSAMLFFRAMLRQYRQGRMVMTRAKTSPARDVLTGLLSRKGFEKMLEHNITRMKSERMYAAFYYIKVSDAQTLKERFGDEGFEVGMVQLAAAISSSISVVDSVGRVAPNAFAVTVLMPRDAKLANGLAQKILTRTMSLASHGAPLAQTGRIAVAWLPVFGTQLPDIERRALRALRKMEEGKRIVWVGGANAQADASQLPDGLTSPTTRPNNGQYADDELPSLPGMINQIEREMLGPDSGELTEEAERLMRQLQSRPGALQAAGGVTYPK